VVPEVSCGRVSARPERAHGSTQLLHRSPDFQRLSITGSFIRHWIKQHAPGHSVDATGSRGRRGGVVSRTTAGKYRKAREVIMTMSEYEEAVSASSAVTASNLRGGPETQPGRKAESSPLGDSCLNRCNDDNIEGRVPSLLSC